MKSHAEAKRLFDKHEAHARKIAQRMKSRLLTLDSDEIDNAALAGLWSAARRFDQSRQVDFLTFAFPRIFGEVIDVARRRHHLTQGQLKKESAEPGSQPRMVYVDFDQAFGDSQTEVQVERRELVQKILERQTDRARAILSLWADGLTHAEIAEGLGLTRRAVGMIIERAAEAIRQEFKDSGLSS